MKVPVSIKQQERKSLAMRLTSEGVEVRIPADLDPAGKRVQRFIDEGLGRLPQASPTDDNHQREAEAIYTRVATWADRLGVEPGRVQVQPMRRKWASMSTRGNLTLASDLLNMPLDLVDYVIVHELLHLKFPNHNKGFQAVLDSILPDWRQREQQLTARMVGQIG